MAGMDIFKDLNIDLAKSVKSITVESTLFPPIVLNDPFSDLPAEPNAVMNFLKPKVTVTMKSPALKPIVTAPYGKPKVNYWPYIRTGALILIGGYILRKVLK